MLSLIYGSIAIVGSTLPSWGTLPQGSCPPGFVHTESYGSTITCIQGAVRYLTNRVDTTRPSEPPPAVDSAGMADDLCGPHMRYAQSSLGTHLTQLLLKESFALLEEATIGTLWNHIETAAAQGARYPQELINDHKRWRELYAMCPQEGSEPIPLDALIWDERNAILEARTHLHSQLDCRSDGCSVAWPLPTDKKDPDWIRSMELMAKEMRERGFGRGYDVTEGDITYYEWHR